MERITEIVNYFVANNVNFSLRNYFNGQNFTTEIFCKVDAVKAKYYFPKEFDIKHDERQDKFAIAHFEH